GGASARSPPIRSRSGRSLHRRRRKRSLLALLCRREPRVLSQARQLPRLRLGRSAVEVSTRERRGRGGEPPTLGASFRDEAFAHFPESFCRLIIPCRSRRRLLSTVGKISPRHPLNLARRRKIDAC